MKEKKEKISRFFALVLLLAMAAAPQFALLGHISEGRNIDVNERLDLRALGIDKEARQILSLVDAHVKFFKRSSDLKAKGIVSPRDASDFKNEGDQRKADVLTIKRELESLVSKLKQGNHWDAAFDAQFAASLKNEKDRSLLNQTGGARKLFEAALGEVNSLRDEIDDELRQVSGKQTGAQNSRSDRAFAAHARPPVGKVCTILLTAILFCSIEPCPNTRCLLIRRYNDKGCIPGPAVDPNCN
jgi:hypothetical protein